MGMSIRLLCLFINILENNLSNLLFVEYMYCYAFPLFLLWHQISRI